MVGTNGLYPKKCYKQHNHNYNCLFGNKINLEKRVRELEIMVNDLVKFQTLLLHSFNYLGKDEEKFKTNIKCLK